MLGLLRQYAFRRRCGYPRRYALMHALRSVRRDITLRRSL